MRRVLSAVFWEIPLCESHNEARAIGHLCDIYDGIMQKREPLPLRIPYLSGLKLIIRPGLIFLRIIPFMSGNVRNAGYHRGFTVGVSLPDIKHQECQECRITPAIAPG